MQPHSRSNSVPDDAPEVRTAPRRKAFVPLSTPGSVIDALIVVAAGAATSSLLWVRFHMVSIEAMLAWGVAAIVVLVVGRQVRKRERGTDAILSSLRAFAAGKRQNDALRVADDFGPLAGAYNRILDDRAAMTIQAISSELDGAGQGNAGRTGELQPTLDAMWYGVVLVDRSGSVGAINGAARVLLGIGPGQAIDPNAGTLIGQADLLASVLSSGGRGRKSESVEIVRESAGSKTYLRMTARALSPEVGGAIVIIEDATAQHVADEGRTALMAHTVHELRTPLTNIRLYVEEALEASTEDVELRGRALNVINHEARRLERVVCDMLSAAEIDSGSLTLQSGDVRLAQMFDELREDYKAAAEERHISLTFDLPPKLPVINGDRDKISLLVHNLIGNALKYTPEGGAVVVRFEEQDKRYIVEVSDTGIGIAPEESEKVFERFYRAGDARVSEITGTGLGLTLAREVARLHGGDVSVDSQVDQGSTFTFWLPKEERAAAA